jgi:hypothetical protein
MAAPISAIASLIASGVSQMNMIINSISVKRSRVETALYTTVYKNGADWNTAKTIHTELYKGNPTQFKKIFDEMTALRFSGEDYDFEEQRKKIKKVGILVLIFIVIILFLFIYKQLKK